MDFVTMMAEEKIREAIQRGELDDLPGKGKPLVMEDLSGIPEDLRAGYMILKNAGILPEELQAQKDMVTLKSLIECCHDEEQRQALKKEYNEKTLRFSLLMEKRKQTHSGPYQFYQDKMLDRFR
ncbi:DUF1992 domain-containing protein [Heliobacterium gestii]|uniref:DUF1992 domain-containing protein n=1 Tax=Heliomicrobium gestii TaxID=2699 RepID=A0A845LD77_HELGE|nr:DUF1992 domain-containing protein [Heliomicrobium gestii]MBM7865248.1 hypothetical protein [Heliomicrobium gestii]MZP41513.1 DUF1992 domain-containing protein [Heliomicrobium gestii]